MNYTVFTCNENGIDTQLEVHTNKETILIILDNSSFPASHIHLNKEDVLVLVEKLNEYLNKNE